VTVRVTGALSIDGAGITTTTDPGTIGKAGEVAVSAGSILVDHSGGISATTFGRGAGGDVAVTAGTITLAGFGAIVSNTHGAGNAGHVSVDVTGRGANALRILTNGEIGAGTFGAGEGGQIVVDVAGGLKINGASANRRDVTGIASQSNPGSTGNAGGVFVRSTTLSIRDGGTISSSAVGSGIPLLAATGGGGKVTVKVAGTLSIDGSGSAIATSTGPGTIGNAGSVNVTARRISLADGGDIASTTAGAGAGGAVEVTTRGALLLDGDGVSGTGVAASATGPQSGAAGTVTVTAGSLTIEDGAEIASSTAGIGGGGDVGLSVSSGIVLAGQVPEISAQSTGSGDAGTISLSASRLYLKDGAGISTEALASTANGGNVSLSLRNMIYLTDSEITTSVKGETGNGGDITIAAPYVILDDSNVVAQAEAGHGGNIMIDAGEYIPSANSIVSASSATGVSGNVIISGPLVDLNGTLVVLSSELRNPAALTRDSCAIRADRRQSSLYEAGRGGLPEDPTTSLPALYLAGRDLRFDPRPAAPHADAGADLPSTSSLRLHCG
jgi:large exoprotein involved in heme utilization and adhesion